MRRGPSRGTIGRMGSTKARLRSSWLDAADLALLVFAAWILVRASQGPPPRYPELAAADPRVEALLRRSWPGGGGAGSVSWERSPGSFQVGRLARSLGREAALPLLKLTVAVYEQRDPDSVFIGLPSDDAEQEPLFACLAELADEPLNGVLVKVLRDADVHRELRRGAAIALSWRGNAGALGPLLERALDRQEENEIRIAVLCRLPRLGLPPPPELRELLEEPFAGIDSIAAAVLALLGSDEAASLVLDGLRDRWDRDGLETLLEAAAKLTSGRVKVVDAWPGVDLQPQIAALEEWLKERPEASLSDFERRRTAYLEGDARRRELALRSLEDILAATEEDLDLASAALLLASPEERDACLEKLHRLASGLGRRLGDAREPERVIEAMASSLLKRKVAMPHNESGEPYESFLPFVLRYDAGNCLGYTTLFLAVGERLGLPLQGVSVPQHLFVRWDDGRVRRNIEVTDFGREVTDSEYIEGRAGQRIPPESLERGVFLRSLTKRELLAGVLANLAAGSIAEERYEEARERADAALRLDPKDYVAYLTRARAVFQTRLDGTEGALEDVQRGLALFPTSTDLLQLKAGLLAEAGRLEEALEAAERAVGIAPEVPTVLATRALCLLVLGRHEEARTAIEPAAEQARAPELRLVRTLIEAWRDPSLAEDLCSREKDPGVGLAVAAALLRPPRGTAPDPGRALAILEGLSEKLSSRVETLRLGGLPAVTLVAPPQGRKRLHHLLRARALLLLGRRGEASAELERAEAEMPGQVCRAILELRCDLGRG
ncbi:MAG: tetratricopeptide repeat protein [Planctomycetes bacterium]|nr:tetratricopeptide repeat protein [Planctomycetota bacterium]